MAFSKLNFILLAFLLITVTPSVFCQSKGDKLAIEQGDMPAEFPKGQTALYNFIKTNLKYPKDSTVRGLVFLYFCVEADGSLTDIKVKRGLGKDFDEEAVRVIGLMPRWKPAMQKGTQKPIKTYYTLPIRFHKE